MSRRIVTPGMRAAHYRRQRPLPFAATCPRCRGPLEGIDRNSPDKTRGRCAACALDLTVVELCDDTREVWELDAATKEGVS